MRIKVIRRLGEAPQILEGSIVLVEDRFGNVINVACELSPEAIECTHAQDPHHARVLDALGLTKTVICDRLELPPPPAGAQFVSGPGGL